MTRAFQPNWASAPGETIGDILHKKNLSLSAFTQKMGYSKNVITALLSGGSPITSEIAQKLSSILGASTDFWINRESQYRADLKRLEAEGGKIEAVEWLDEIPLKDMIKFGWLPSSTETTDKIEHCLDFFDVPDVAAWRTNYQNVLNGTAFRTSLTFVSQPAAVCAWLRQGEIESKAIQCKPWNAARFKEALSIIRLLTRKKDPNIFLPELTKLCADCGVAVVIVRAPTGCRASGATRFISKDKAILQLSFRYRTDDHFWFTFFHEAGHLLLHGKHAFFLENVDIISPHEEDEANDFAASTLVPPKFLEEMYKLGGTSFSKVMRFAKKVGVSAGIIVGQMQHKGLIKPSQLNFLKTRFVWE